jgi:hypothetical protein
MIRDVPFKVSFDLKLKANANIKILKKRIFFGLNSLALRETDTDNLEFG